MSKQPIGGRGASRSRTPRFREHYDSFTDLLARVRSDDVAGLAQSCQARHKRLQARCRQARYEDGAIAIGIIYAIEDDAEVRDRFKDAFHHVFGREAKGGRTERAVFLFLYGEKRKDVSGTDAIALADAIRRRVPPEGIPDYIRANGGLEKLLNAERSRRDPFSKLEISIRRKALKRLDELAPGARIEAVVMRSWASAARYAIVKVRS